MSDLGASVLGNACENALMDVATIELVAAALLCGRLTLAAMRSRRAPQTRLGRVMLASLRAA